MAISPIRVAPPKQGLPSSSRLVLDVREEFIETQVKARRAFALDQPVVATTWPNITPLALFDAFAYSGACFFVISRRALIDNL